jgi:hypothetical protein
MTDFQDIKLVGLNSVKTILTILHREEDLIPIQVGIRSRPNYDQENNRFHSNNQQNHFFRTRLVAEKTQKRTDVQPEVEPVETKQPNPNIINLSKRDLSNKEITILERGLKSTPTPKADSFDLKKDIEEFCRKFRLREFFQSENNEDESLVRNKKGFQPPFEQR